MDALLKAVKKNPIQRPFSRSNSTGKHKKLPENWADNKDPVKDGVTFYVKYLGSTLVEEIDDGESYGNKISSKAVHTIVDMAKASGKKLDKMAITVCKNGIRVIDMASTRVVTDLCIYRICFCTADKSHEKVFAYIARNTENETMECHAFLCQKRKIAEAVTLTVSQAFNLAKEEWEDKSEKEQENTEKCVAELDGADEASSETETSPVDNVPCDCLVTIDDASPSNERPQSGDAHPQIVSSGFEDSFVDDPFAQFAELRSKTSGITKPSNLNPFAASTFTTDLQTDQVDDAVFKLARGQHGGEEIHRAPSIDDLLGL